jgi:transcriptional regulator with XRE-family HTH domain
MRAPPILKAFGKALREQRERKGLSQEALALEAEIDRSFVSQIERGLFQPSLSTLFKLADALEIRASVLIARTETLL